jgi:SAM-dependent methyltransferase
MTSTDDISLECAQLKFGGRGLEKLLRDYDFDTVLDIGCGEGHHAKVLLAHGKKVTAIDYGKSPYFENRDPTLIALVGDFNTYPFADHFDCVWASHVLEHQLNPHSFLRKVHEILREGGTAAITVPTLKNEIVGGHVSLWNAGLLLYHLVIAGFDCRFASLLTYGRNISVIVVKRTINVLDSIVYDKGDIRVIREYLPKELHFHPTELDDPFDGNIARINW